MPQDTLTVQPTGIDTLDEILNGGIPKGHAILLAGNSGSGKTVLSLEWLFRGAAKFNEPGLYMTTTEPITKARKNAKTMTYYTEAVEQGAGVRFTDLRTFVQKIERQGSFNRDDADELLEKIKGAVEETGAKRFVLDSVSAPAHMMENEDVIRYFIFRLGTTLSALDCTTILTSEVAGGEGYSVFGVEEFISDGIIKLDYRAGEQATVRSLNVIKMRGVDYRSGSVNFDITEHGLRIYPKIPVDRSVAQTDFETRRGTGVSKLDEITGGGFPEGHMILIGGNTGCGKSLFGLNFVAQGVEEGENSVYVSLEEPIPQVVKTAEQRGMEMQEWIDSDAVRFTSPQLIDTYPDEVLYSILDAVEAVDADRVVFDSISSLLSASLQKEEVRQFLLQLVSFFKTRGVTAVFTYLSSNMFNARPQKVFGTMASSDLRLSSVVDGIILLRYVEEDQTVKRALHVLKMRGIQHSPDIYEYKITDDAIDINGRFTYNAAERDPQ